VTFDGGAIHSARLIERCMSADCMTTRTDVPPSDQQLHAKSKPKQRASSNAKRRKKTPDALIASSDSNSCSTGSKANTDSIQTQHTKAEMDTTDSLTASTPLDSPSRPLKSSLRKPGVASATSISTTDLEQKVVDAILALRTSIVNEMNSEDNEESSSPDINHFLDKRIYKISKTGDDKSSTVTNHAPKVFRHIRQRAQIDDHDFLEEWSARTFNKLGGAKDHTKFIFSKNGKYVLQTIKPSQGKILLNVLVPYYEHIILHPNALLTKILGFYELKRRHGATSTTKKYLIVTQNRLHGNISDLYFLKASQSWPAFSNLPYNSNWPTACNTPSDKGSPKFSAVTPKNVSGCLVDLADGDARDQFLKQMHSDTQFLIDNQIDDYAFMIALKSSDAQGGNKIQQSTSDSDFSRRGSGMLFFVESSSRSIPKLNSKQCTKIKRKHSQTLKNIKNASKVHEQPWKNVSAVKKEGSGKAVICSFGIIDFLSQQKKKKTHHYAKNFASLTRTALNLSIEEEPKNT